MIPQYTLTPSWLIQENVMIDLNNGKFVLHPYTYVHTVHNLSKDTEWALKELRKFLHERIDQM